MKRMLVVIAAAILFLTGFAVLLYPHAENFFFEQKNRAEIRHFRDDTSRQKALSGTPDASVPSDTAALLEAMQTYNGRIFQEGQTGMTDAWSDVDASFDFEGTGLEDEMIGYITIPAMDVELPLYIGADTEHLEKGAAVLAQTSMPVGGENTNCVIAAHRGYGGKAMFREIERLVPGDRVEVTNLWETLEYEVVKCIVICPDDIDAVKIIPGEDMVTLVTCHPYTKNYQRYVVYCARADENGADGTGADRTGADKPETDGTGQDGEAESGGDKTEPEIPWEGVDYESSEPEIRREQMMSLAGILTFVLACLAAAFFLIRVRRGREKTGKRDRKQKGSSRGWRRSRSRKQKGKHNVQRKSGERKKQGTEEV